MSDQQPQEEPFQTYMLVVAHPDDAEFSSAGTIAKLAKEGKKVILIQVTSGDMGTADPSVSPIDLAIRREAEECKAAKILGIDEVVFLRVTDGTVVSDMNMREKVVRMIRTYKPDVILTHDPFRPYALHPDHRAVGMATTDAVYPTARDPHYFPAHGRAGLEPHKTAEIWYFGAETPDLFIDITDTFDTKIAALREHESQVGKAEGLEERLRERAQELAKDQPFELAEAFKVVKMRR
ncbi:MAG TPA: PIG-L deacetylase family protein [Thermomicrobiales bacterium]|nr:PIG-L deacetylase family protein [Thermomicrobiales bacterium]